MEINKKMVITGGLLLLLLILSIVFFSLYLKGKTRRILLFPEVKTGKSLNNGEPEKLLPEIRFIKNRAKYEDTINEYIKELFLGSAKPGRNRLVPFKAKLIYASYFQDTLKVSFTKEFLWEDRKVVQDLSQRLQTFVNNLMLNFKNIKEIDFIIAGEQVPRVVKKDGKVIKILYENKIVTSMFK